MPAKSVEAFFDKVAASKALQTRLRALHRKTLKETKRINDQASAEVVKIAAAAGFRFRLADLTQARKRRASKASQAQLSEVMGQSWLCTGTLLNICLSQNWQCGEGAWY